MDALGSYQPAIDKRVSKQTEFRCVEVHPGIIYVVRVAIGDMKAHEESGASPLPKTATLVATFTTNFPKSDIVSFSTDDLMDATNDFWRDQ